MERVILVKVITVQHRRVIATEQMAESWTADFHSQTVIAKALAKAESTVGAGHPPTKKAAVVGSLAVGMCQKAKFATNVASCRCLICVSRRSRRGGSYTTPISVSG